MADFYGPLLQALRRRALAHAPQRAIVSSNELHTSSDGNFGASSDDLVTLARTHT
jgi:hypothetical protein